MEKNIACVFSGGCHSWLGPWSSLFPRGWLGFLPAGMERGAFCSEVCGEWKCYCPSAWLCFLALVWWQHVLECNLDKRVQPRPREFSCDVIPLKESQQTHILKLPVTHPGPSPGLQRPHRWASSLVLEYYWFLDKIHCICFLDRLNLLMWINI